MEVLDAATAGDGVERGANTIDGGVGGEQLAAVDGVGAGGGHAPCGHVADLPLAPHAAQTQDPHGCRSCIGVGGAIDHAAGGWCCCNGGGAVAQGDGVGDGGGGGQAHGDGVGRGGAGVLT